MRLMVKETTGREPKISDFVVFMHPNVMKKAKMKDGRFVRIKNTVRKSNNAEKIELVMEAPVLSMKRLTLSHINQAIQNKNPPGNVIPEFTDEMIGIDQTYCDALGIKYDEFIEVIPTGRKRTLGDKILSRLNFQKIIVRANMNHTYLERKRPMIGLCLEMVNSIGVSYGDQIVITSGDGRKRTNAICLPLTTSMQKFHDDIVHQHDFDRIIAYTTADRDEDGVTNLQGKKDRIHPIFLDAVSRRRLGISTFHPIRIRRSFRWEILKKLNSLSSMNIVALPVMLLILSENPTSLTYWILAFVLGGWLSWSLITSTTYNSPLKEFVN